jgi:hypothetical protein
MKDKYLLILFLLTLGLPGLAFTMVQEGQNDTDTLDLQERDIPVLTLSISDIEGEEDSHDISSGLAPAKVRWPQCGNDIGRYVSVFNYS